jgi:hypothetical protein
MPYSYDVINMAASQIQPGTVRSQDAVMVAYYRRYLLDRAMSVFKWTMPEDWDENYVKFVTYGIGFFVVINTDRFGIIPQHGTLSGRGVMYTPTHVIVSNPLINQVLQPRINEDCALIRLRPDYGGIMDLVNDYAEAMALTSQLFSLNTLNSRLSFVFGAGNKRAAESYKSAMDRLYAGDPMVVVDKDLLGPDGSPSWQLLQQNVGQNYVAGEALENLRRLECMFNNEVGIPANLATAKKERTISAEVEANDTETYGRAAAWLESLQKGCRRAREMFGIDLNVEWRVDPMDKGGASDGNSEPAGDL